MYDVFISYRRDGGFETARLIYEHFSNVFGMKVFFDLEELRSGKFNLKLYSAIDESENFILVLPKGALDRCVNEDDWLRLEILHAMQKEKNIIPLMLNGFTWPDNLPDCLADLSKYNGVTLNREYFDASMTKLVSMLRGVNITTNGVFRKQNQERRENPYHYLSDEERHRLYVQQELMKSFDREVYDRIKSAYDKLYILDVGSSSGDLIMDRLGRHEKLEKLIGIEYSEEVVKAANDAYGEENRIAFYNVDAESQQFPARIKEIMAEQGIEGFNVINISMLLLHLKTPYKLLKNLRQFLTRDGIIVIKDIDDGYNIVYPDEKGEFNRVMEICSRNETSGYRQSGRQIYTLLGRAGYNDIKLEKLGLTTIGMDYDEREAVFETYFSFVLGDLLIMKKRYPNDKRIANDYEWYSTTYEELEEKFHDNNLFFSLGFMLFTARR